MKWFTEAVGKASGAEPCRTMLRFGETELSRKHLDSSLKAQYIRLKRKTEKRKEIGVQLSVGLAFVEDLGDLTTPCFPFGSWDPPAPPRTAELALL